MVDTANAPASRTPRGIGAPVGALFVLAGPAQRGSDLAPLARPPALLPIGPRGECNAARVLRLAADESAPTGHPPHQRILIPNRVSGAGLPDDLRARLQRDHTAFRGTGGILADAATGLPDETRILVLNGAEVFGERLRAIVREVVRADEDVVLCRTEGHEPLGVCAMRARCLRLVSALGYQDLKEQILPLLARLYSIRVVTLSEHLTRSFLGRLTDRASCLACRALLSDRHAAAGDSQEVGASIAPGAVISDAMLLSGAQVGSGAVVARSIIGEGVTVRSGQRVIDRVLVRDSARC